MKMCAVSVTTDSATVQRTDSHILTDIFASLARCLKELCLDTVRVSSDQIQFHRSLIRLIQYNVQLCSHQVKFTALLGTEMT
jgi:hypothetical protein